MINTHWQFILLGAMALLLPSILALVILLWRAPLHRGRQNRRMR
jgi:hypothetical protein